MVKTLDIEEKIIKRKIYLNQLNAKRIEKSPEGRKLNIEGKAKGEIVKLDGEKCLIRLSNNIEVVPSSLFSIFVEFYAEYIFNEKIDIKILNENLEVLLNPIGNEMSFLISFITEKMTNNYIILPPGLLTKLDKE